MPFLQGVRTNLERGEAGLVEDLEKKKQPIPAEWDLLFLLMGVIAFLIL